MVNNHPDMKLTLATTLLKRVRFLAVMGLIGVMAMTATQEGTYLHTWGLAMAVLIGLRGVFAQARLKALDTNPASAMRHIAQDALHVATISTGWGLSLFLFESGAMDWSHHTRITFLAITLVIIIFSNGSVYLTALAYTTPLFLMLCWLFYSRNYIVPRVPHMVVLLGFGVLLIAIVRQMHLLALERYTLIQATQALNVSLANEKQLHKEMAALSHQDELTGILNRRGILAALGAEIARAHRHHTALGILVIDIDHFKRINDTHGHAAGDAALRAVTYTIESLLRESDSFGRLGGDELLLVLPHLTASGPAILAERVRQSVANLSLDMDGQLGSVTLSIGVASLLPTEDSNALLARADQALYSAKTEGKNKVVLA